MMLNQRRRLKLLGDRTDRVTTGIRLPANSGMQRSTSPSTKAFVIIEASEGIELCPLSADR
jgi:hypothetical protein